MVTNHFDDIRIMWIRYTHSLWILVMFLITQSSSGQFVAYDLPVDGEVQGYEQSANHLFVPISYYDTPDAKMIAWFKSGSTSFVSMNEPVDSAKDYLYPKIESRSDEHLYLTVELPDPFAEGLERNSLFYTTNAGLTWDAVFDSLRWGYDNAIFENGDIIVHAANDSLVITTDLGDNWSYQGQLPHYGRMTAVGDSTLIHVYNYASQVSVSKDRGASWDSTFSFENYIFDYELDNSGELVLGIRDADSIARFMKSNAEFTQWDTLFTVHTPKRVRSFNRADNGDFFIVGGIFQNFNNRTGWFGMTDSVGSAFHIISDTFQFTPTKVYSGYANSIFISGYIDLIRYDTTLTYGSINQNSPKIYISPIPSSASVNVFTNDEIEEVELYDIFGKRCEVNQILKSPYQVTLDVSSQPSGCYIVVTNFASASPQATRILVVSQK